MWTRLRGDAVSLAGPAIATIYVNKADRATSEFFELVALLLRQAACDETLCYRVYPQDCK